MVLKGRCRRDVIVLGGCDGEASVVVAAEDGIDPIEAKEDTVEPEWVRATLRGDGEAFVVVLVAVVGDGGGEWAVMVNSRLSTR